MEYEPLIDGPPPPVLEPYWTRRRFLPLLYFLALTGCAGLLFGISGIVFTASLVPECRVASDCAYAEAPPCLQFACEKNECVLELKPNATCSVDGTCREVDFGSQCNVTTCQCENPCDSIICESDACTTRVCDPILRECVVAEQVLECCLNDDQCNNVQNQTCITQTCENNQCKTKTKIILQGSELSDCELNTPGCDPVMHCSEDEQCAEYGLVCNQTTCSCVDPCLGVPCESDACTQRVCVRPSGVCVEKDTIENCCLTSDYCPQIPCQTSVCVDNRCGFLFPPQYNCSFNQNCAFLGPNAMCIDCICYSQGTNGTCTSSQQCVDNSTCTIDVCTNGFCEHIPQANCCEKDSDCANGDACTTHSCNTTTGMCVFNLLDQDGDNWTCGTDCDDNNASIGGPTVWYFDKDGDGRGDPNVFVRQCYPPPGYVMNDLDCSPGIASIWTGSVLCDYQNQQVLSYPPLPGPGSPFVQGNYTGCGTAIAVFGNLTVDICPTRIGITPFGGQVQTWVYSNSAWVPQGNYQNSFFGYDPHMVSIAVYEDVVVVGSDQDLDPMTGYYSGSVSIFRFDFSTGNLNLLQTIYVSDLFVNSTKFDLYFGHSVDIFGTTIVVGFPQFGSGSGAVVVLDETIPDKWTLTQVIYESRTTYNLALLGWSVSIFGDQIVIGVPSIFSSLGYVIAYQKVAFVWIFQWETALSITFANVGFDVDNDDSNVVFYLEDSSNPFVIVTDPFSAQEAVLSRPYVSSTGNSDNFGQALSIRNDTLIVGAHAADGLFLQSGVAFVYKRTPGVPGYLWAYQSKKYPTDLANDDGIQFGYDVAVTTELIIGTGAPKWDNIGYESINLGAVYMCECVPFYPCPPLNQPLFPPTLPL